MTFKLASAHHLQFYLVCNECRCGIESRGVPNGWVQNASNHKVLERSKGENINICQTETGVWQATDEHEISALNRSSASLCSFVAHSSINQNEKKNYCYYYLCGILCGSVVARADNYMTVRRKEIIFRCTIRAQWMRCLYPRDQEYNLNSNVSACFVSSDSHRALSRPDFMKPAMMLRNSRSRLNIEYIYLRCHEDDAARTEAGERERESKILKTTKLHFLYIRIFMIIVFVSAKITYRTFNDRWACAYELLWAVASACM